VGPGLRAGSHASHSLVAFVPDVFGQALNGLAYGVLLFLLSVGLTLIFGMLDVVNLAHGSYYMLGAYAGLTLIAATHSFWLAVLVAPVAVGLIGAVVEGTCLRPLYRRGPLDQVLLTFGLIYLFEDLVKWIWGGRIRSIPTPAIFSGSVNILGATIPSYRLFVIAFGLVMAVALWLLIERTRLGAVIRAGVFDSEMTAGMGINIHRVFTGVFAFGAGLAGLSGVIAGPIQSAYPPMGASILVPALIVVVVGGLGSLKGSLAGSLIIGQAETFGKVWLPGASMLMIYVVMALILLFRPQGLFGRPLK
jgi:branched-subunit amino acid ABC-type transport system permease component